MKSKQSPPISEILFLKFFFLSENFYEEKHFVSKRKKNIYVFLVLPFEQISIQPEISSPPRFRIQGGYPERDRERVAGLYFPFLIQDNDYDYKDHINYDDNTEYEDCDTDEEDNAVDIHAQKYDKNDDEYYKYRNNDNKIK